MSEISSNNDYTRDGFDCSGTGNEWVKFYLPHPEIVQTVNDFHKYLPQK